MSGFGWTPGSGQQPPYQGGVPYPSFPGQAVAPPPGYQGMPPYYYQPQAAFPVQDPMQASKHMPSYSQTVAYTDSSDEDEGKSLKCTYYWKRSSVDEPIPANAVIAGRDMDGCMLYVGKAKHNGKNIPAKVIPERRYASICYAGKEHSVRTYKVLCEHTLKWVPCSNGNVPEGAVPGGETDNGEKLYVGRANIKGALTVGKVHRSHGCLYIPFGGEEHAYKDYEVLVQT